MDFGDVSDMEDQKEEKLPNLSFKQPYAGDSKGGQGNAVDNSQSVSKRDSVNNSVNSYQPKHAGRITSNI